MPRAAHLLAAAASLATWDALPETTRRRAREVFLDTVVVMAGGLTSPLHGRWRGLLEPGAGPATVLGRAEGGSVSDAVFCNATLPTVLQLDEGYRASRGHPGIHVVPVALAVGEQQGRSLGDVLAAMVAGYEVAARVGVAMGGTLAHIHPHGNWGAVGAAVTAAWLYADRDPEVIARAIDIASGVAGMHDRRAAAEGAGMHHLWASVGAHTGLMAGSAAAAGAEAVDGALTDHLLARSGVAPDETLLVDGVGAAGFDRYLLDEGYIKFWAACGHTHTAIGAALRIVEETGPLTTDDIAGVEVRTFRAAASLHRTDATTALGARFSIPFTVAAALTEGALTPESLDDARLDALRPLARRVEVTHDPAMDAGYPARGRPLQMTVRLADGRTIETDTLLSVGDPELPADSGMLEEKATSLIDSVSAGAGSALVRGFRDLTAESPIHGWATALRAAVAVAEEGNGR